jgi:hypothetical protein
MSGLLQIPKAAAHRSRGPVSRDFSVTNESVPQSLLKFDNTNDIGDGDTSMVVMMTANSTTMGTVMASVPPVHFFKTII